MVEGVGGYRRCCRHPRFAARRQFQQGLGRLGRQVVGQGQQRVLGRVPDVVQPLGGHAVGQQFLVAATGEQRFQQRGGRRCERQFRLHIHGNEHLPHRLADFDPLRGAGPWVGFQPAPFRPVIGPVMVVDVAEQEARIALVHDQANVAADTHRPEIPVPRPVQPVQAHAGVGRVELQVEGRGLDRSLLVAAQARQAIGEGVGNAEFHRLSRATARPSGRRGSAAGRHAPAMPP
ncbi:MAG: hypothetical protein AW09_001778 [Candidatus Accumulibacter phosphatis]|uniref:Uncharacterized protein n=1 Tax=Candidatus Accumulibacter phosphatis TaxID=327160 RepID=A0A080LWE0_9PROT|nr:MAG: hypothetical protein AW09_001778 [Candidatus Accumulibacter phosphatis]